MRNAELLPPEANSAFRIPNSALKKDGLKPSFLLVAALRDKSNLYASFRAIVDCYEFIKSRQPELIFENVSVER